MRLLGSWLAVIAASGLVDTLLLSPSSPYGPLCWGPGIWPHPENCRLFTVCHLKQEVKGQLYVCPENTGFSSKHLRCIAQDKVSVCRMSAPFSDKKLSESTAIRMSEDSEKPDRRLCYKNHTSSPFCVDDTTLVVCGPREAFIGSVDCSLQEGTGRCDRDVRSCVVNRVLPQDSSQVQVTRPEEQRPLSSEQLQVTRPEEQRPLSSEQLQVTRPEEQRPLSSEQLQVTRPEEQRPLSSEQLQVTRPEEQRPLSSEQLQVTRPEEQRPLSSEQLQVTRPEEQRPLSSEQLQVTRPEEQRPLSSEQLQVTRPEEQRPLSSEQLHNITASLLEEIAASNITLIPSQVTPTTPMPTLPSTSEISCSRAGLQCYDNVTIIDCSEDVTEPSFIMSCSNIIQTTENATGYCNTESPSCALLIDNFLLNMEISNFDLSDSIQNPDMGFADMDEDYEGPELYDSDNLRESPDDFFVGLSWFRHEPKAALSGGSSNEKYAKRRGKDLSNSEMERERALRDAVGKFESHKIPGSAFPAKVKRAGMTDDLDRFLAECRRGGLFCFDNATLVACSGDDSTPTYAVECYGEAISASGRRLQAFCDQTINSCVVNVDTDPDAHTDESFSRNIEVLQPSTT